MRRLLARVSTLFAVAAALSSLPAMAAETSETIFQHGVAALEKGDYPAALDSFEALADRGFVNPDLSYNRALAYIGRVRAGAEKSGDLGRAAAALEEVLIVRPKDADAVHALEIVREEVAKRRARQGTTGAEVDARPSLRRTVLGLASERVWAALAAFGSTLLTLGLAFRRAQKESPAHLFGTIAGPIGAASLLVFGTLAFGARDLRTTTQIGVVVAPSARLLDEKGAPLGATTLPEAAKVEIGERRGSLVSVRWGAEEGWLSSRDLRVLPRPKDR